MKRRLRQLLAGPLAAGSILLALTASLPAQTGLVGGLVVTTANGLYRLDTTQPYGVATLAQNAGPGIFEGVLPVRGGSNIAFLDSRATTSYLMNHAAGTGSTTTLASLTNQGPAHALCRDQDGQYLVGTANTRRLLKTTGIFHSTWSTLFAAFPGSGQIADVCMDDDTGDYVIALHSTSSTSGMIVRLDRDTLQLTTIRAGLTRIRSVDHDQVSGRFVVARGVAPEVILLDRNGTTFDSMSFAGARDATFDDVYGRFAVAGGVSVELFSMNLVRNLFVANKADGAITHCALAQAHKLTPATTVKSAVRGSRYAFSGRFPDSPRAGYVVAVGASGLRPGITIANRLHVNVALDALFFVTVAGKLPLYTTNFIGTLDGGGSFSAGFVIPNLPPAMNTLTIAAAAVNQSRYAGLDIAPSLTVKVAP